MHSVKSRAFWINIIHCIMRLSCRGIYDKFIVSQLSSPSVVWPKNYKKIGALFHALTVLPVPQALCHVFLSNQMWHRCVFVCVCDRLITILEVLHHLYLSCMGCGVSVEKHITSQMSQSVTKQWNIILLNESVHSCTKDISTHLKYKNAAVIDFK